MVEINVNVRFPDLLGILEQFKQNLPTLNDLVNRRPEAPTLNDLVNRQPAVYPTPLPLQDSLPSVNQAPAPAPVLPTTVSSGPDVPKATLAPTPEPVAPVESPKAETPTYTLAQVARAGADLLTAKPALQPKLIETLGKYGAQTVVDLKAEHLAAFADDIRKMGAKI